MLSRSGKNIWKIKFSRSGNFLDGQGNLEKDLESQGKVREFENKWQSVFRKFIYSVQEGKESNFSKIV